MPEELAIVIKEEVKKQVLMFLLTHYLKRLAEGQRC